MPTVVQSYCDKHGYAPHDAHCSVCTNAIRIVRHHVRSLRLRVLLDVDGVLADFTGRIFRHRGLDPQTARGWDAPFAGLTREERRAMHDLVATAGWCLGLPVLDGAVEGVRQLREVADVLYCTTPWASSRHWVVERTEWLERHFGARWDDVMHTAQKRVVCADVLIDDKPSNVAEWKDAHPDGLALLWPSPHNTDQRDGFVVPTGWDDVVRLIRLTESQRR